MIGTVRRKPVAKRAPRTARPTLCARGLHLKHVCLLTEDQRMDLLSRIKRLILADAYAFSRQALDQMDQDGITELDVLESVANAQFIRTKRSTSA